MTQNGSRPSLADPAVADSCRDRISLLSAGTASRWGTMDAGRMCAHCAEVLEVAAGRELVGTPWYIRLLKPLVRRAVTGDRPYRRGVRTHPQYRQTGERDFARERDRLLRAVDAFEIGCRNADRIRHPFFGLMPVADAGWAMFKHLDHHLRQFGV